MATTQSNRVAPSSSVGVERGQLDAELVIETAGILADAEGLDSLTLTRVAKELGISQPALYRHVKGYDDLIRSLSLGGRRLLNERLQEATIGVSRDDAVRAMGHAWRKVVKDRPGLYSATDRYPSAGDAELESAVEQVVETLAQALVGYDLTPEDAGHAARALRSAFHGFSHLEAGDGHPQSYDLDDTFDHIIDLLCAGIGRLSGG